MFKRSCTLLFGLAGVLLFTSCAADPSTSTNPLKAAAPEPIRLTEVAPPPGVTAVALKPYDAEQSAKARLSRAEVVASLTPPRHLERFGQPAEASGTNPPLAAQRFFVAGKQALLENDNFRAVQQLEKALRLSPNEPEILRSLGQAWTRAGNRVTAAGFFRRAFAADPTDLDSVFLLGRLALDERRWESAILNLDAALRLADPILVTPEDLEASTTANPAAAHLLRYYLANALNQANHGQAAAQLFKTYLSQLPRLSASSPYAREVAILASQRGEAFMLLGDLQHRLNDPVAALASYTNAQNLGVLNDDTLLRRMLYTRLRMGQPKAAQDLIARGIADSAGNTKFLELIPYALDHGVSADALSARLTELYQQQGQPASLALAAADALPAEVAAPLLREHLRVKPGDDAVFGRLLAILLGEDTSTASRKEAIALTISAMADSPEIAERFVGRLLAATGDPAALLNTFPGTTPANAAAESLRGKLLIATGQQEAAFEAFEQALNTDGSFNLARLELAALLLSRGETDAAEALLAALDGSADPRAARLRARVLTEAGDNEAALALIDETLRRLPPGSPLMMDKAALLLKLDRVAEAEQTLLDALNARPTDEAIYIALLEIYDSRGDLVRNYQRLVRRMVDTIPNARITQLVKAETLVALGQFAQADVVLKEITATDEDGLLLLALRLETAVGLNKEPEEVAPLFDRYLVDSQAAELKLDAKILNSSARYFTQRGDRDRVLLIAAYRLERQPPSGQRSLGLSRIYLEQGRISEAVDVAREAIDQGLVGDDPIPITMQLTAALIALEGFDEAAAAVESLIDSGVDDPAALGITVAFVDELIKRNRLADAEKHVGRFTAKRPAVGGDAALFLAIKLEELGDTPASRRVMEAALKDDPDHAPLNNSLGYGLANEGIRLDDAERMIARAVEVEPDSAAYLDSMGWVFYKKGEFEKALEWLKRSEVADGGIHPVIIDHLGDANYRLGRSAEAVRFWNTARRIMSAEDYESFDPEEADLPERLEAKIRAVAEDRPAPVAQLGDGVELPASPAPTEALNPAETPGGDPAAAGLE